VFAFGSQLVHQQRVAEGKIIVISDTIEFTADDVALAISDLTDVATSDIDYVSQQQMAEDMAAATLGVRSRVMSLAKLHGINSPGDADLGEQAGADFVKREVERFHSDPGAYLASLGGDDSDEEQDDVAEGPALAQVAAATPAPAPVEALVLAPVAPPPAVAVDLKPVAFVKRAMKDLFPGISSTYHGEMVDTAKWKGKKPHVAEPDPHYSFDGFSVKVMTSAMRRRRNVMAVGDPGCGKTEFFRQFAARIGLPYHGITFDGQLSRAEIIGSFRQIATPTGSATPFIDGLIPTLIQRPGILCLNEVDQCDPDIQYMLHDMYEGGGLTIQEDGGRFVPRHPDCYIVATANTKGRGSDNGLTHARHEMSEATRDRYSVWLNFTYMKAEAETATIVAKTSLVPAQAAKLVAIGTAIRNAYKNGSMSQPCSLRQLLDVAEFTEDFMEGTPDRALALACDIVLAGRANTEDTLQIREFVKQKTAIDLTTLER
jgi:MoxR-like ATPase